MHEMMLGDMGRRRSIQGVGARTKATIPANWGTALSPSRGGVFVFPRLNRNKR